MKSFCLNYLRLKKGGFAAKFCSDHQTNGIWVNVFRRKRHQQDVGGPNNFGPTHPDERTRTVSTMLKGIFQQMVDIGQDVFFFAKKICQVSYKDQ